MAGKTNEKCKVGHASISSGVGVFWSYFDDLTKDEFTTIGWPSEAAASVIFVYIWG